MSSQYSCSICGAAQSFGSKFAAFDTGWALLEVHSGLGNLYGVFCDKHDTQEVLGWLADTLPSLGEKAEEMEATLKKKKK